MRKYVLTIWLILSCVVLAAQDSLHVSVDTLYAKVSTPSDPLDSASFPIDSLSLPSRPLDSALFVASSVMHRDTMDARELTMAASVDDDMLLELLRQQALSIAAREDSAHQARLLYDTTTLVPLHLGYADSLKIAQTLAERGTWSPFCVPVLYLLPERQHFPSLDYTFPITKPDPLMPDYGVSEVYANTWKQVRKYLTTCHADLYTGMQKRNVLPDRQFASSQQQDVEMLEVKALVQDSEEDRRDLLRRLKQERSPWYKEATILLQFTQNYVSPTWYEGGNSALSLYSHATGLLKYDDKKRINWESQAEWRAGLTTVSGDSLRKINCSEDLLRLYSKLGVKIVEKLYGSLSAEFRAQLLPTYKANSYEFKTFTFTPIRFNLALGVDVKPAKGLSLVISPVTYKLVYAYDTIRTTPSNYGIEHGNMLNDIGSSLRLEWKWKPIREFQLEAKLYAYTNYKTFEADLEVTSDFIINRFFSIRAVVHPRYDSALIAEGDDKARFQFKELLSIGFAHKFH
ncbi:MAG: DUF3078 domain-containing protein [Paludibacteraceae bacterium]|nr:DUF3078 domain-containing protein [Paludibacteraceae bacterium]